MLSVLQLFGGLGLLLIGGEWLVRGSSRIASALGMSRLLIGMTIVSLGTSSPELAISLDAVLIGTPEIALGNIVGSNIANVLLILGLTALFYPISVSPRVVRVELPLMTGFSILFLALVIDGSLSTLDGLVLSSCMLAFVVMQIRGERNQDTATEEDSETIDPAASMWQQRIGRHLGNVAFIVAGGTCLWLGANSMVEAAVAIAKALGASELVIGLTIVSIGSSTPEIVTAIVAAKHGHAEMALGSVLGSNIANLLVVGGLSALIGGGIPVPKALFQFDIPVMLAAAFLCFPVFVTGQRISRREGGVFLSLFCCFTIALIVTG